MTSQPSSSNAPDDTTLFETLLTVERFLSSNKCVGAAAALRLYIDRLGHVPKRIDYTGKEHERTYKDYLSGVESAVPDLTSLISRLSTLSDGAVPASVKGLPLRLLVPPRNALDRTEASVVTPLSDQKLMGRRMFANTVPRCPSLKMRRCRELGLRARPSQLVPASTCNLLERQYRVTGHLAPIYCLHLDRRGEYILTGADDNLIKVWCMRSGMLRFTMRGHSQQIGDMSISYCNTKLATGSVDKSVRVWDLQNGALIKVYFAHTATITSVKWIPFCEGEKRWLVSTSYDCCVNFYAWDTVAKQMCPVPIKIYERDQPGMRLISLTHSLGGLFVGVGDSHSRIRLFQMTADGPVKSDELAAHTDRVDSLVWSHHDSRFASGSGDGTARVWRFSGRKWKSRLLALKPEDLKLTDTQIHQLRENPNAKNKYKLKMLCWSQSDEFLITSGSDFILRVWNSTSGDLVHSLRGHIGDAFALHPHPLHTHLLFTAGHDGLLILWDILAGRLLRKWENSVVGIGNPAIYDLSVTEDGTRVALVDQEGQLSVYGIGSNQVPFKRPKMQFFSTDYEMLARDDEGWVVDESTGIPPHLMPPPLLTNGNEPLGEEIQRMVPGRDVLNKREDQLECAWGDRQIITPLSPEMLERLESVQREVTANELAHFQYEMDRESEDEKEADSQPIRPSNRAEFRRRQRELAEQRVMEELERAERREREHPFADRAASSGDDTYSGSTDSERGGAEEEEDSNTSDTDFSMGDGSRRRERGTENGSSRRNGRVEGVEEGGESAEEPETYESGRPRRKKTRRERRSREEDMDVAGPSTASRGARPTRSRRRVVVEEEDEEREEENGENGEGVGEEEREQTTTDKGEVVAKPKRKRKLGWINTFPAWMSRTVAVRFPYIAQLGDSVVYFRQGHVAYLEAVQRAGEYTVEKGMWPGPNLNAEEFCVVVEVKYTRKPYRLTSLRLHRLDAQGKKTGFEWNVRYHDMDNVPDFLVLRHHYDESVGQLDTGDQIEALLEDKWWTGVVHSRQLFEERVESSWFCLHIKWDNGDEEKMSPWDCQAKTANRRSEAIATEAEVLALAAYPPTGADWPGGDREGVCRRMRDAINSLSTLPDIEPFTAAVPLDVYPNYALVIDYPCDLETIAERLHNLYYRRLSALQQDIRYLALNAEYFNAEGTPIVRTAKVLVETLIHYSNDSSLTDPLVVYGEVCEMDDGDLVEYRRKQREREVSKSKSAISTVSSLITSNTLSTFPEWMSECKSIVCGLMREQCARHFIDRNNCNSEEMRTVWEQLTDVEDFTEIIARLDQGQVDDPGQIIKMIDSLLSAAREAVDNNRSTIHNDSLTLGRIVTNRLNVVVDKYWGTMSNVTGVCGRRLRKRMEKINTRNYNTRGTMIPNPNAARLRSTRPRTGYYSELLNPKDARTPPPTSSSVAGPSRVRVKQEDVQDTVTDAKSLINRQSLSREASVQSEESRRSERQRKRPARYESDSSDCPLPSSSRRDTTRNGESVERKRNARECAKEESGNGVGTRQRAANGSRGAGRVKAISFDAEESEEEEEEVASEDDEGEEEEEEGQTTSEEEEEEEEHVPVSTSGRPKRKIAKVHFDSDEDENADPDGDVIVNGRGGRGRRETTRQKSIPHRSTERPQRSRRSTQSTVRYEENSDEEEERYTRVRRPKRRWENDD